MKELRLEAGYRRQPYRKHTAESIIAKAQWWYGKFGVLSANDWNVGYLRRVGDQKRLNRFYRHGGIHLNSINEHFGSWGNMKLKAGIPASPMGQNVRNKKPKKPRKRKRRSAPESAGVGRRAKSLHISSYKLTIASLSIIILFSLICFGLGCSFIFEALAGTELQKIYRLWLNSQQKKETVRMIFLAILASIWIGSAMTSIMLIKKDPRNYLGISGVIACLIWGPAVLISAIDDYRHPDCHTWPPSP